MKKSLKVVVSIILVMILAVSSFTASAIVTSYGGTVAILPGNTRSSSPVYNYAWLDNIIIRDDAMAVTAVKIKPQPTDYQGSHTCDEFVKEVDQYSKLFELNEDTLASAYDEVTKAMYYVVAALGMTDEYEVMREYLEEYGIKVGGNEGPKEKMQIAVVYAALKYDAVYTLYNKHVIFPTGVSLEGAMVIILAALTNTVLPSGIDTFTGFAVLAAKNYVEEFESLPLSDNPDEAELFHWTKALTASAQEYKVPIVPYDEATIAQKQYVDYAYYASILATVYDVKVDPIYLVLATQSAEEYALQKLILKTMLDEKNVPYDEDTSLEELFKLAVDNGWFALEDELYSDILNYKFEVAPSCSKVWFTPFVLAGQLDGGSDLNLDILLNDKKVTPSSTTAVELDSTKEQETVRLALYYDDGEGRKEHAVYEFLIIKNPELEADAPVAQNDMVAQVEDYVDRIVPVENEAVSEAVDKVFSGIDSKIPTKATAANSEITTYAEEQTTYSLDTTADFDSEADTEPAERFDFDYLDDLINGVYATDENGDIVVTSIFDIDAYDTGDSDVGSIIEKATEAVKENPEIVVAPTSLMAVGSFAGYLLSKKHRGSEIIDEEDSYSDDDDE